MVINGLNSIIPNQELLLGFTPGIANNFSIKATEISNFDSDTRILLKDNQTNTEQDLTDGITYSFSSEAVSAASRFAIIFKTSSITTVVNNTIDNSNTIFVYKNSNNQIVVNCKGDISRDAIVSVFNAVGENLQSKQITGINTVINNAFTSGVYVVSVYNAGNITTKKIILN